MKKRIVGYLTHHEILIVKIFAITLHEQNMKLFRSIFLFALFLPGIKSYAQTDEKYNPYEKGKNDTIAVALTRLDDGSLVPWLPLSQVDLNIKGKPMTPQQRALYNRLRYNVMKVWPYAVIARQRYERLQMDLAVTSDRKQQKKLVKACDDEIKKMFNKEIKNMTITQGDILIKLIDRETGNSSYEMVRQLRGGFTAFSYQVVAKVFGHNLKEKYNPEQDRDIEMIVRSIDSRQN
jgi:hypothetical protein